MCRITLACKILNAIQSALQDGLDGIFLACALAYTGASCAELATAKHRTCISIPPKATHPSPSPK
jgi:hypothetical protein